MSDLLVRSRLLVTRWGGVTPIPLGAVFVQDGIVQEIGEFNDLQERHPTAKHVGDGRHLVVPGFVNSHSHGRGVTTLQQGIPDDPGEVRAIGLRIGLSGDPYWDVLLSSVRQLEAGITSTMHLDSNYGFGPADLYESRLHKVISAYRDSGLRFSVAMALRDPSVDDPYLDQSFLEGLDHDIRSEIESWRRPLLDLDSYLSLHDRLKQAFPATALQFEPTRIAACSTDFLTALRKEATARGTGIQLHLSETAYQKMYSLKTFGVSTVQRLADMGFLCSDVSCAHCVWLTQHDIDLVREAGAMVVQNPGSNLRLRSGIAPIRAMIAKGVHVAIGTDNLALADGEDILAEARLAQVLQSPPGIADEQIGAVKALQWATVAGARVLGIKGLGSLELGCPADLVMLHTRSIDRAVFDLGHDVAASVLHWLRQHDIDQVLVGGQILVRDGRYIFRDRDEVERKAVEASQQWAMTPAIQLLRSQVQKRYASQDLSGQPYYWLNATN